MIFKQARTKPCGGPERRATIVRESDGADKTASTNAGCAHPLVNVREHEFFAVFVLAIIQSQNAGSRERPAQYVGVGLGVTERLVKYKLATMI